MPTGKGERRSTWGIRLGLETFESELDSCKVSLFREDPLSKFRENIRASKTLHERNLATIIDLQQRTAVHFAYLASAWSLIFDSLSSGAVLPLRSNVGENYAICSNSPGRRYWVASKTVDFQGRVLCWVMPVDVSPGVVRDASLNVLNALDLNTIYNATLPA